MTTTFARPAHGTPVWSNEPLFELDPDLAEALLPADEAAIRDVLHVRCVALPAGPWEPKHDIDTEQIGLLLVSGNLAASLTVAGRHHLEILGPGDVCQPWVDARSDAARPAVWRALRDSQVAILDRRFVLAGARCPALMAAVMQRLVVRSRRLLFQLAVLSVPQITRRIELVMWHFADRWGRVTPNGIVLDLPLTHELLARVVGAQRPSVTTALGELRERGRLERRCDGTWLLAHEPPAALVAVDGRPNLATMTAAAEPDLLGAARP